MSEISDLIFEANKKLYKITIEESCKIYENDSYNIEKIYENNKLVGIFIYIDLDGIRYLDEAHYIGKDHIKGFKYWRKMFDKNKRYRTRVLKFNTRMLDFYKKMKFNIIKEDESFFYLEYIGG